MTPEQNESLTREVSLDEIWEAVKSLPKNKAPGCDGVRAKFFQALLDDIQDDLLAFIREVMDSFILILDLNTSKISLLPKAGDVTFLTNQRPISLIGTAYKIIAKLYATRMLPHLPYWIRPSQSVFVKGRNIFDNIYMACEAMDYA